MSTKVFQEVNPDSSQNRAVSRMAEHGEIDLEKASLKVVVTHTSEQESTPLDEASFTKFSLSDSSLSGRVRGIVPGMSRETWEDMRAIDPQNTPEEFHNYCHEIVARLFPEYKFEDEKPLVFVYGDSDEVFASFYGTEEHDYINVSAGLLRFVDNEDQLAAVLGHEFTHLLCEHEGGSYARQAEELFADHTALSQLAEAGYNPDEMLTLFERLDTLINQGDPSLKRLYEDIFSEHGHMENRITALKASLTKDWINARPDFHQKDEDRAQVPAELLAALRQLRYTDPFEVAIQDFSNRSFEERSKALSTVWNLADNTPRQQKAYEVISTFLRQHKDWGTPETSQELKCFLEEHIENKTFRNNVDFDFALETIRKATENEFETYSRFEPLQTALCRLTEAGSHKQLDTTAKEILEELRTFTEEAKPYRNFPVLDLDVSRFIEYPFLEGRDRRFPPDEPQSFEHLHQAVKQSEALQDVALIYNLINDPRVLQAIPDEKLQTFLKQQSISGVATVCENSSGYNSHRDSDLGVFRVGSHRTVRQFFRDKAIEDVRQSPQATTTDPEQWSRWSQAALTVLDDPSGVYQHGEEIYQLMTTVITDCGQQHPWGNSDSTTLQVLRDVPEFQNLNAFLLEQIEGYGSRTLPSYDAYMQAVIDQGPTMWTPSTLNSLVGTTHWNSAVAQQFREESSSELFEKTRLALGLASKDSYYEIFREVPTTESGESVEAWPRHWEAFHKLEQQEKQEETLSSGDLSTLLYNLGEHSTETYVVNGARYDLKLVKAIDRSDLWPSEAAEQVELYKKLQARKCMPLDHPLSEKWTQAIASSLSELPASEDTSKLIATMIAPALGTHAWREQFCSLFAEKSAEFLGHDDGSNDFFTHVQNFASDLKYGPFRDHPGQHHQPFVRLADAVTAQRDVAYFLEELEDFKSRDNLQKYADSLTTVQAVHTLMKVDDRLAPEVLNFLRNEYSAEESEKLFAKIAPYQDDALQTLSMSDKQQLRRMNTYDLGKQLNFNSSDLRQLHSDFWSAGIEARTLIVEALVDRGRANYNELLDEVLDNANLESTEVQNSASTKDDESAEENSGYGSMMKTVVTEYFGLMPEYVRSKLIAGMLAVEQKSDDGESKISPGQALATMAVSLNDPALLKLCQAINSNPDFPKQLRDEVAFAKTDASPLSRGSLWAAIDNETSDLAERVEYLGRNLGNGSYYVVNEAMITPPASLLEVGKDASAYDDLQALGLLRPNARQNAEYGFSALETLADRLGEHDSFSASALDGFRQAIAEARHMMNHETDTEYGLRQAEDAQNFYDTTAVEIGGHTYKFHTYEWNETGKNHKAMQLIQGTPLNKFLADEQRPFWQKRDVAQSIVLREITSMMSGNGFDYDRHSGNYIIGEDLTINVIDTGAKELGELSKADKAALGSFLGEALVATATPGGNRTIATVYQEYCELYQKQGRDVPRVVIHAQKGLLALGDYASYLDAGAAFNMVNAIRHHSAATRETEQLIDPKIGASFQSAVIGDSSVTRTGIQILDKMIPKGVGQFRLVDSFN